MSRTTSTSREGKEKMTLCHCFLEKFIGIEVALVGALFSDFDGKEL